MLIRCQDAIIISNQSAVPKEDFDIKLESSK